MTLPSGPDKDTLLLHAYIDGELDSANVIEFERRLAADAHLTAERDRIEALRRLVREKYPNEAPSYEFKSRILRLTTRGSSVRQINRRALAASFAATAFTASIATWLVSEFAARDTVTESIVSAHIRGLLTQATDVVSSDRHTVKPWFSSRMAEAPRVIDLTSSGFALFGGRIDVIERKPAPTLLYRRRQHVISVTALSKLDSRTRPMPLQKLDGFNVVRWKDDGVMYFAVSDLNLAELEEFARLFRTSE
jgi:anti-sigma factor RsiW